MGTGGRDSWWGTFERPQSCSRSSGKRKGQGSSQSGVGDPSAEPPEARFHIRPAPCQAADSSEHHCTGSPRRKLSQAGQGDQGASCAHRLRGRACTLRSLRACPPTPWEPLCFCRASPDLGDLRQEGRDFWADPQTTTESRELGRDPGTWCQGWQGCPWGPAQWREKLR